MMRSRSAVLEAPPPLQRGLVLGALLILVGCVVGFFAAMWSIRMGAIGRGIAARRRYLAGIASMVNTWYADRLSVIWTMTGPIDAATLFPDAGVVVRFGLALASSARVTEGGVVGHRILLWLPGPSGRAPHVDLDRGVLLDAFDGQTAWISGISLQQEAVRATRISLERFARQLERWAVSRVQLELGDIGCNVWRPAPPCQAPGPALSPFDGYVDLGGIDWTEFGIEEIPRTDAWGGPIQVSNATAGDSGGPPWPLSLRATPPFGGDITVIALSPLS